MPSHKKKITPDEHLDQLLKLWASSDDMGKSVLAMTVINGSYMAPMFGDNNPGRRKKLCAIFMVSQLEESISEFKDEWKRIFGEKL